MRFNGIDPRSIYPGISIAKEIPPGTVNSQLETLSGAKEEIVVGRTIKQGEYIVRINIAGKNANDGWAAHRMIKAWARPMDVMTCELVPTHWPSVAYDAILKDITPPEFKFGFVTIDVAFAVPRPIAHDRNAQIAQADDTMTVNIGGTSYIRPEIRATMKTAAESISILVDDETCIRLVTPLSAGDVVKVTPDARILVNGEDASTKVDYIVTDPESMQEKLTPGQHVIRTEPSASISMEWRCEWL